MEYYVGLDVSLRTVAICVIDANGKQIFERSVACEIEDIVDYLRDDRPRPCTLALKRGR